MYTCPKCSFNSETAMNYCPQCGNEMVHTEPVAVQEVAAPFEPTYVAPIEPVQPIQNVYVPAPKPHLALKIVGMALSITGLVFLSLGALYTLIGLVEEGLAFAMALVFALFFLPLSIVGLCLSNKCLNAGDVSAMSRVGKILGIIGIIIAGVSLFIGFTALIAAA